MTSKIRLWTCRAGGNSQGRDHYARNIRQALDHLAKVSDFTIFFRIRERKSRLSGPDVPPAQMWSILYQR
jgi:hypothetical protein